jgi:endonuclease YncB( thermonuclease family)
MKTKRLFIFLLIIILLALLSIHYPNFTGEAIKEDNYEKEKCFVERVIDGDTMVCGNQTIRLLGINTKSIQSS